MFKKILLPVDGSEHGRAAAKLAGTIASLYDAEVVLLHVLDRDQLREEHYRMVEVEHVARRGPHALPWVANVPAELGAMLRPVEPPETRDQTLNFLAERVVKSATDVLEDEGVPSEKIRVAFRDGKPAQCILQTVESEGADAVIMGSRGMSEVKGLVLGSVSHRVASVAPCTVITTRAV